MTELLTDNQRKTMQRHQKIIDIYDSLDRYDKVSQWRKIQVVAKKVNMTPQGVRHVLITHNKYRYDINRAKGESAR